jgi:uncharacterized protein (DUF427 family)
LEAVGDPIEVHFNGVVVVSTTQAYRVLETSHPPTYYLPPADVKLGYLTASNRTSWCEFKGRARYYDLSIGARTAHAAAWSYDQPTPSFEPIAGYFAFYCHLMDTCRVGGEVVRPQPGNFYGGWITANLVGPFKGGSGSAGW